jgi:hypothetical protein
MCEVIIIVTFFIPTSPRWLLSKDRHEEALASLRHLRPNSDPTNGKCELEIQSIREVLKENVHKAPWSDLFSGGNLRRTVLVIVYYFFQQVSMPFPPT